MSKINDLSSNGASRHSPETDLAAPAKGANHNTEVSQKDFLNANPQLKNAKPEDLMASSYLMNATLQLKSELSRKLDGNNSKNQSKDEPENGNFHGKRNSSRQNGKILIKLSATTTSLQALKLGFMKHAAEAGLSNEAQEAFAEEHTQKFAAQAEARGFGDLLEKAGDFTLLTPDSPLSQSLNSDNLLFQSLNSELPSPQSPNSEHALFQPELTGNNFSLSLGTDAAADLRQVANPAQVNTKFNGNQVNARANNNANAFDFNNSISQRAIIEARLPASVTTSQEFKALKTAIQEKIEGVLKSLGLGKEMPEKVVLAKAAEDLRLASEFIDAPKSPDAKDKALFAMAFGVANEAAGESRELYGDGVLQEFVNYGGEATATSKEINQIALAKLLQHGSQAGFDALLKSAKSDFSSTDHKIIEQVQQKLGADKTTNLVVGVVTMSVMTREVVEQLNHVTKSSSVGLSDNALAALQKAHNSLRDHLTPTDVIGAVGNLKNEQIEIAGEHYNFLPEVSEALNSLREARGRILSETMHLKSDASGADAQQRFVREAENLFGITERIESILGI